MNEIFHTILHAAVSIALIVTGCAHYSGKRPPQAIDGLLDLRDWDFERDGPVHLQGTMEFYWDTLLSPQSFASGVSERIRRFVPVPAPWNKLSLPSPKKPYFFNGTYRLRILMKNDVPVLALRAISQVSALKLWLNGHLLLKEGKIGSSWRENDPRPFYACGMFNRDSSGIQMICQIACFNHFRLALPDIDISSSKDIINATSRANMLNAATVLLLLIIAAYSLIIFLKRRKDFGNLYLALIGLFCAGICLTDFFGDVIQDLLSSSPSLHIMFADLLIIASILFLRIIFPLDVNNFHIISATFVSGASIVLWAFDVFKLLPTGYVAMIFFFIWLGIVAIFLLYLSIVVILRRRECNASFLISMLVMSFLCFYNASYYLFSNRSTAGDYGVDEICFFVFALCQLYILALRHAQTQSQLAQKYEEIIHTEKLATLGTVVANVAHEINNPNNSLMLDAQVNEKAWNAITPILDGYAQVKGEFPIGGYPYSDFKKEFYGISQRMKRNSERIRRITEDLRSFSKKEIDFKENVDINDVVRSGLSVVEHITKRSTKNLTVDLSSTIPHVKGNIRYLEQVIINLVKNACQSLPSMEKGIFIATSHDPKMYFVTITVQDEGMGMDDAALKNVFTPFYTTKGAEGTGLGLSICNNIVKSHNGRIEIESKLSVGTTIRVILPVTNTR